MSDPNGFLQPLLDSMVPWLYSEKRRELVVPSIFWHLSFWGSVIALIYAFHVDKLPIILGYFFLPILYARNLVLLARGKRKGSTT